MPASATPAEPVPDDLAEPDLPADDGQANDDNDSERYIVPALRRGLSVLRLFSRERRVVTLPEIVRELGVPRATA
ncbi:MAG: IclR family transcriptional regulator, partial [Burkholderia sp.]|nr:IclR family transcriptional regulator [Burkholderia sp.]